MKSIKLYVQMEHFNDWSYYTRDFDGVMTIMRYYYPYKERGYSFEAITVNGKEKDTLKSFIRRFRYLGNIIDVVSVNKLSNRQYEVIFLGDIRGMLKYIILNYGGIVVSSHVGNGVKDFTAYFITKGNDADLRFNDLYNELSIYGRVITFKVSRLSKHAIFTSPIYELTDIERKVLLEAYNKGFFNYPRNAKLDDLSREFGLSKATINIHLRNALRKIINAYINNASHE